MASRKTTVLLLHGVDSSPASFLDLRRCLAAGDDPIKIGTFAYANDEAIDRIGDQLAARLKKQAKACPDRDIILVAHSMGGLVARYMLETPGVDPGNVSTLIMLATPNHGSRLSRLRPGVDLLTFLRRHGDDARLVAPINDGMGEAGFDMWPDSPFLTILNRRPRNPAVTYHLILGDKGILSAARMREFREQIMNKVRRLKKQEIYAKKIAAWLDDLHEVLQGEGDGAVSLRRGSLAGVEPVVLPFGHLGMLRSAASGQRQPVFAQVLVWVEAAR